MFYTYDDNHIMIWSKPLQFICFWIYNKFIIFSETATPPLDSDENKSLKTVETPNKPVKTSKRPLLGYDWIAANMDNQLDGPCHGNVSAVEMSDHVIKELAEFRNSHKRECHSRGNWDRLVKTPKNPKTQLTKLPKLVRFINN